jgi:hypothetical protein
MELPQFVYQPPPVQSVIESTAVDFGILVLFNLVFFAGAFAAFMRFDVR